jgi:small subunit ribosomal protein S12
MSTINQRLKSTFKFYKKFKRPKLNKSPQRKGIVLRLRICTPRKPNSARRPVVKAMLSTQKKALSHIPGAGHTLKRHSRTLVKGVGARDLPVVNYTCIRGVYDFEPLRGKRRRRSVYGVKLASDLKTHVRRSIRNLI